MLMLLKYWNSEEREAINLINKLAQSVFSIPSDLQKWWVGLQNEQGSSECTYTKLWLNGVHLHLVLHFWQNLGRFGIYHILVLNSLGLFMQFDVTGGAEHASNSQRVSCCKTSKPMGATKPVETCSTPFYVDCGSSTAAAPSCGGGLDKRGVVSCTPPAKIRTSGTCGQNDKLKCAPLTNSWSARKQSRLMFLGVGWLNVIWLPRTARTPECIRYMLAMKKCNTSSTIWCQNCLKLIEILCWVSIHLILLV